MTIRSSGPPKIGDFWLISPLKTLKIPKIFARLRRVWDPKNDRLPRKIVNIPKIFARLRRARDTIMTDLPRANLKIPSLLARRRPEKMSIFAGNPF